MTAQIRHAQIVGTGLIGGSIAMALKSLGWHVTGRDKVPENATKALSLGAIDLIGSDPEAEFTFVAVPASSVEEEVRRALDETVGFVTDTGSVKASITSAISNPRFIPGHPMAGSEQDGVNGSDPKILLVLYGCSLPLQRLKTMGSENSKLFWEALALTSSLWMQSVMTLWSPSCLTSHT